MVVRVVRIWMLGCLCLLLEPSRAAWKKSAVEKTGAYFEKVEPVKIIVSPRDIIVGQETRNLAAVFLCGASGFPSPHITWMYQHRPIVNTPNTLEIQSAGGLSVLTVSSPSETDTGVYTCVADNGKSTPILSHAKLVIEEPPKPTKPSLINNLLETAASCQQILEEHYILTDSCRSYTKIKNRRCQGVCPSSMQVYPTQQINCYSCRGSVSYPPIKMLCRDGRTRYVRAPVIKGCRCRSCKLTF